MDLLLFITVIAAFCVLNFLIGLFTWFVVFRKSELNWLREIRNLLILFTIFSPIMVFIVTLFREIPLSGSSDRDIIDLVWYFIAPLITFGFLGLHTLALHLKIKRLESKKSL